MTEIIIDKVKKVVDEFVKYLSCRHFPLGVNLAYLYPGVDRSNLVAEMRSRGYFSWPDGTFDYFTNDRKQAVQHLKMKIVAYEVLFDSLNHIKAYNNMLQFFQPDKEETRGILEELIKEENNGAI